MTAIRVVEPRLSVFVEVMRHKLELNEHKTDWRKLPLSKLRKMLRDEVAELERAIDAGHDLWAITEAADVANLAMMIADKYRAAGTKRKRSGNAA